MGKLGEPGAHKTTHETDGSDEVNDVDINAGTIDGVTITSPAINGTISTSGLILPAITLGGDVTGGDYDLDSIGHIGLGGASADFRYGINYTETYTIVEDDNYNRVGTYNYLYGVKETNAYSGVLYGGYFGALVHHTNTQNWTDAIGLQGVYGRVVISSGGDTISTITGAASFHAATTIGGATNDMVLTNYYGLYVDARTLIANEKLTNDYGIYIGNQAGGATLNYAIYTNAGLVHFGDDLDFTAGKGIGAFTLGGKLTAGAVEIEGSAFDINGGTIDGVTFGNITMDGAATVDGVDVSTVPVMALAFALCS